MKIETLKLKQIKTNDENPRTITGAKFQKLVTSILVFPKMLEIRPVVIDAQHVALGGNMRTNALNYIAKMTPDTIAQRLNESKDFAKMTDAEKTALADYWGKWLTNPTAPIIRADTLTPDQQRQFIIKDNVEFGAFDYDMLANNYETFDLDEWGMDVWQPDFDEPEETKPVATRSASSMNNNGGIDYTEDDDAMQFDPRNPAHDDDQPAATEEETDEETIERKRAEFEEKMANGELNEDDPEYQAFIHKFDVKRTTDDCYTPELVYNAVADFVEQTYGLNKKHFKRPFYPNGDYQNENYEPDDIVVDNPPFSIMSKILNFYHDKGVKFFLFAPHLALFSSSTDLCTALPVGVCITYANGARVNTSFLTNLEPETIRARTEPTLYKMVKEANEESQKAFTKQVPRYKYDKHIITSTMFAPLSRMGVDFVVPVNESAPLSRMGSQRDKGKEIFGKGYIVSDRVVAARHAAELLFTQRVKEQADREFDEYGEIWDLSDRERAIVETLNNNAKEGV